MMSVMHPLCPGKRRKPPSPLGVVRCTICMRAVTNMILSAVVVSSFEFVALSYNAAGPRAKARSAITAFASTKSGAGTPSIPRESTVRVVVKRSMRNPVDTSQLAAYGSIFYATGYEDGWVLMQTISGVADGKDVIAVVSPGKYPPGSSVDIEYRYLLEKPGHLDWDRATMLPFLAINCLCPLRDVGYDQSNARGQNFVVTGGHGSLAPFMVQVLKAWGANVHCVTTRSQKDGQALGAESVVDFREQSYSEEIDTMSVVIDTLGREKEGSARMLKKMKGAAYLSLQPQILKRDRSWKAWSSQELERCHVVLAVGRDANGVNEAIASLYANNPDTVAIEEGVIFGAGKILQYQQVLARADARVYFLPNAEAMGLVSHVASMVSSREMKCGEIGTEYVGMQEYLEALAWPKDTDTGLRYGFPGKPGRSWGWLEGGFEEMEDDDYDDEDQDDDGYVDVEGDRDPDCRRSIAGSTAATQGPPSIPAGEVVPLNSREELMALARERGLIVFISSKRCRVCKFLSPFYRKLARRQQLVWFGYVDASSNPEIARDLGLKAVPSFVTFREGELVSSTSTNNREKIEKLVEELLPS